LLHNLRAQKEYEIAGEGIIDDVSNDGDEFVVRFYALSCRRGASLQHGNGERVY
jgi:hypothetical protein